MQEPATAIPPPSSSPPPHALNKQIPINLRRFVAEYYGGLRENPEGLLKLYSNSDSDFAIFEEDSSPDAIIGDTNLDKIRRNLSRLTYSKPPTINVKTVVARPSRGAQALVLTTGVLIPFGQQERPFTQAILLAPNIENDPASGYYIRNDVLHFLKVAPNAPASTSKEDDRVSSNGPLISAVVPSAVTISESVAVVADAAGKPNRPRRPKARKNEKKTLNLPRQHQQQCLHNHNQLL